jgi:hypothetical protein
MAKKESKKLIYTSGGSINLDQEKVLYKRKRLTEARAEKLGEDELMELEGGSVDKRGNVGGPKTMGAPPKPKYGPDKVFMPAVINVPDMLPNTRDGENTEKNKEISGMKYSNIRKFISDFGQAIYNKMGNDKLPFIYKGVQFTVPGTGELLSGTGYEDPEDLTGGALRQIPGLKAWDNQVISSDDIPLRYNRNMFLGAGILYKGGVSPFYTMENATEQYVHNLPEFREIERKSLGINSSKNRSLMKHDYDMKIIHNIVLAGGFENWKNGVKPPLPAGMTKLN